jgi:hypothetical protein
VTNGNGTSCRLWVIQLNRFMVICFIVHKRVNFICGLLSCS